MRARLKQAGIEIPLSLSLEAIASVHDRQCWDALAPLDSAKSEPLAYQYFGVHSQSISAAPANLGWITVIQGPMGYGKTMLGCAMARMLVSEAGLQAHYLSCHRLPPSAATAAITYDADTTAAEIGNWAANVSDGRGVVVVDEIPSQPQVHRMLGKAAVSITGRGHCCVLITQGPFDMSAFALDSARSALLPHVSLVQIGAAVI